MGDWQVKPAKLRRRARDGLIVAALSLMFLKIPLVMYFVPILAFGGALSAHRANRQLLGMKEHASWTGVVAIPVGLLVGTIGIINVVATVGVLLEDLEKARDEKREARREAEGQALAAQNRAEEPLIDAAPEVDAPRPLPIAPEYADRLEKDARSAGVDFYSGAAPMAEKFLHVTGSPEIRLSADDDVEEVMLRMRVVRSDDRLTLQLESVGGYDLAYRMTIKCTVGVEDRPLLPSKAMPLIVGRRDLVVREDVCAWETKNLGEGVVDKPVPFETEIVITELETIAVPPLAAHYLGQPCVKFDSPGAGWRDVVDFYARHSCASYTMPVGYKAFDWDGAQALPATKPKKKR